MTWTIKPEWGFCDWINLIRNIFAVCKQFNDKRSDTIINNIDRQNCVKKYIFRYAIIMFEILWMNSKQLSTLQKNEKPVLSFIILWQGWTHFN